MIRDLVFYGCGRNGFGDLDLKKGVDHDLKLEKGEVWNKI